MTIIVQKFGGTSVADLKCIHRVAEIIRSTREQGHDVVAVVSAMSGETDRLIQLAYENVNSPCAREYDALVSTGEQVSAALLSMALVDRHCPSRSFNGGQVKIYTDGKHRQAKITEVQTDLIRAELNQARVPVIAGFQGVDDRGHITTLGRGGSDITAVALAAALQADECQIFTDVEGVFTSDPRVVADARLLARITYDEMLELAGMGAKVLQTRSVEFAQKYHVPLRVLSTFNEGRGTLITADDEMHAEPMVSGIAFDRNHAKLTIVGIPNQPGYSHKVLERVGRAAIAVDMVVENVPAKEGHVDFSFTVHLDDYKKAFDLSRQVMKDISAQDVIGNEAIAKLSLVGLGMKSHAGVASKMIQALGNQGIGIHLITSSEIKISAVVDEKNMELGARTLHADFGLASLEG